MEAANTKQQTTTNDKKKTTLGTRIHVWSDHIFFVVKNL